MDETLYNLVNSVDRLEEAVEQLTGALDRLLNKQHDDVTRTIECFEMVNNRICVLEEALAKMGGSHDTGN